MKGAVPQEDPTQAVKSPKELRPNPHILGV